MKKALRTTVTSLFLGLVVFWLGLGIGIGPVEGDQSPPPITIQVTTNLENSFKAYVELNSTFQNPDTPISLNAVFSPVSTESYARQEWKGQWARMVAALAPGKSYSVRVTIFQEKTGKPVWQDQKPIDAAALAEESRKLVPDKFIRTHFDVDSVTPFQIPAGQIPSGTYRVLASFMDPAGAAHPFKNAADIHEAAYLIIRAVPLTPSSFLLPSSVADAPDLRTKATLIANPGRRRFPKEDANDCQARSVWALTTFQNRVFVGYGDWDKNRGPIDLWSFTSDTGDTSAEKQIGERYFFHAGTNPRLIFQHEYTVQEESIIGFRVSGNRLLLPGIDGNKEFGPDGRAFGSVYIREKGFWRKLSGLENSWHVEDVIEYEGRLFALTIPRGILVSHDGGISWQEFLPGQWRFGAASLVPWKDNLLIFGESLGGYVYRKGRLMPVLFEPFPGSDVVALGRVVPFRDSVVYTANHKSWRAIDRQPLYVLHDPKEQPLRVELFRDKRVCDLSVQGDTLTVLTAEQTGNKFTGEVYTTTDLRHWTRAATFTADALPNAVATLGGKIYVGLANRGYDAATYDAHGEEKYAFADQAAGDILQLNIP